MQNDKFPELIAAAGGNMADRLGAMREHAEHFIAKQVEAMKESGQAVELGDDELRLLKAYRAFKARSAPGTVFAWTTPNDGGIVLPPDLPSLLVDPREAVIRD